MTKYDDIKSYIRISVNNIKSRENMQEKKIEEFPLVSIITPTYNHEKYISQCIESVLSQTYPYWEQLIIDDGSTDKTGEIVEQYQDNRIKYIKQENIGIWRLNETYNRALQLAQGELIAILEGDDFWPPWKLERQVPAFNKKEIVLTGGRAVITNNKGEPIDTGPKNFKWFNNKIQEEILQKLFLENFIPACTTICRRNTLLSCGGFQQPKGVPFIDYPTWLRLGLKGELQLIDEILGYWRQHKNQVTEHFMLEMVKGKYKCSIDFYENLPNELRESYKFDIDYLKREYQNEIGATYFALGRRDLFNEKWHEARENFMQGLIRGNLTTKLKSLVGVLCSFIKIDLELVALLMNRPRLNSFLEN